MNREQSVQMSNLLNAVGNQDWNRANAMIIEYDLDVRSVEGWALRLAAAAGSTSTVKLLLDRGADVDINGGEALRHAAQNGHAETVALLLARGADPDRGGGAARAHAERNGHQDVVERIDAHLARKESERRAAQNAERRREDALRRMRRHKNRIGRG